jgi:ABC-type lipoprotein export system ATPase subunit
VRAKHPQRENIIAVIETTKSNSDTFAFIRKRKTGFVFQSSILLSRTPVLENVELLLFSRRHERGKKG